MRILLIEPDQSTAQSIELMLRAEGHLVYTTDLGEEGVDLGKLYGYDAIVLEPRLTDLSGFDVIRQLRLAKVQTPIIVVSGLAGIDDKVRGLGFGADDYMTKPFHKDELVARIIALVRRSRGLSDATAVFGNLSLHLSERAARIGSTRLHLTRKQYDVLEVMALRPGKIITKEMFLNHLYGGMDEPELKIVDVFIHKLRRALFEAGWVGGEIETVWGRGYLLSVPGVAVGPADAGHTAQLISEAVAA